MEPESENKTPIPSHMSFMADSAIVEFFNRTMLDPHKFMLNAIKNHNKRFLDDEEVKTIVTEQNNNIMMKKTLIDTLQKVNQIVSKISFHESELTLGIPGTAESNIFVCPLCSVFRVTTKKGLAAHKRKCEKNVNPTLV
jgi:hypothetical protein